jgi:hypothetical protein
MMIIMIALLFYYFLDHQSHHRVSVALVDAFCVQLLLTRVCVLL